jgi:uncharacterized membrane protein (DUF485 family)
VHFERSSKRQSRKRPFTQETFARAIVFSLRELPEYRHPRVENPWYKLPGFHRFVTPFARMADPHADLSPAARFNARLGIVLFIFYLLIYAGFVALSAFAPTVMAKPVLGGVNLAVVYGFALIGLAFVMAIVYAMLCRREPSEEPGEGGER